MANHKKTKHISEEIKKLDPVKDHQKITYLVGCHAFSWDLEKAMEFGLFRTFAVPSISKLLSQTGEFKNRPQKRYDDTELFMYELLEHGYDSERAKRVFRRMNKMHNSYNISNDDLKYVLTTFIYTPIYWIEKYGWRKPYENEKIACFNFFREVGKRMNIKDIPDDYNTFERFHHKYEEENFKFSETNLEIAKYTRKLLMRFYLPPKLGFIGYPFVHCFMDNKLIVAMGLKKPPLLLKMMVMSLMKLRAFALRFYPERKKPYLGTKKKRKTYPEGYEIEELGTHPLKK